ncbi:hypothetical protein FDP41_009296 [Naegleria fowleri]|uniref:Histidine kinase n=1 Tax=Naegleria fowleri TaxID=5763 RepID=A0A6A5AXE5_NAEFO|nr:uncharacterized protein FDP41_009296 [Naegleria fowleri]KAF0972393.1 hypothetical protein FDP41_009296 [Naegleria fowleri]
MMIKSAPQSPPPPPPPHRSTTPTEYTINIRSFFLQKRDRIVFLSLVIITLTLLMPMYNDFYVYYHENYLLLQQTTPIHQCHDDSKIITRLRTTENKKNHMNDHNNRRRTVQLHSQHHHRPAASTRKAFISMHVEETTLRWPTTTLTTTESSPLSTTTTASIDQNNHNPSTINDDHNNNNHSKQYLSIPQIIQRLLVKYLLQFFLYVFLLGIYWKFHNVMNFIFRHMTTRLNNTTSTTTIPPPSSNTTSYSSNYVLVQLLLSFLLGKISLSPQTILLLSEITRCTGSTLWIMCVHLVLGKHAPAYLWILVYACLGSVAMEISHSGGQSGGGGGQSGDSTRTSRTHTTTYMAISFMVSGDLFVMIYFLDYTLGYCVCVAVSILIIQVMTIELIDFMKSHSIAFVQQREVESLKHMTNLYKNLYMSAPDTFLSCVYSPHSPQQEEEELTRTTKCLRTNTTTTTTNTMVTHHHDHDENTTSTTSTTTLENDECHDDVGDESVESHGHGLESSMSTTVSNNNSTSSSSNHSPYCQQHSKKKKQRNTSLNASDDPYQCLKHFKIIQYNHAACDMLGYHSEQVNNNSTNSCNSTRSNSTHECSLTLSDLILNPNEHSSEELKSAVLGGNDATIHELQLKSMIKLRSILFDIMECPHSSISSSLQQQNHHLVMECPSSTTSSQQQQESPLLSGSVITTTTSMNLFNNNNNNPQKGSDSMSSSISSTMSSSSSSLVSTNSTTSNSTSNSTTNSTTCSTNNNNTSSQSLYSHDRIIPLFILGKNGSIMTCSMSVSRIVLYDTVCSSHHKSNTSTCHTPSTKLNHTTNSPTNNTEVYPVYYNMILHDLTQKYKLLDELNIEKEKAVQANNAKSQFLAQMSHELRTPLHGIIGLTDVLLQSFTQHSSGHHHVPTTTTSASTSSSSLNQVLSLSSTMTTTTTESSSQPSILSSSYPTTTTTTTGNGSIIIQPSCVQSDSTTTLNSCCCCCCTQPQGIQTNSPTNTNAATSAFNHSSSALVKTKSNSLECYYHQQAPQQQYIQLINTIQTIKYSGNILLGLINDLLDICKIESSKIQLECKPFNLRRALNQIHCGIFQHQAQQKNLNFTIDLNPNVPTYVVGDENRLVQILINLVYNAIKFTDQGSVSLSVEREEEVMLNSDTTTTTTTTASTNSSTHNTNHSNSAPENHDANATMPSSLLERTSSTTDATTTTTTTTTNNEHHCSTKDRINDSSPNQEHVVQESSSVILHDKHSQQDGMLTSIPQNFTTSPQFYIIKFKVTDTGIGISPNDMCKLFRPFSQIHSNSTSSHKSLKMKKVNEGTGLGLYICKQLVELMGGELNVKSEEGKGSCFYFSVKLGIDDSNKGDLLMQHSSQQFVEDPSSPLSTNELLNFPQLSKDILSKLKILIVEDNSINRIVLINMLKKLGCHNIDTAKDGVEGCELYTSSTSQKDTNGSSKYYDIAFIDIYMPRMNGYGVVQHILESESKEAASNTTALVQSPQVQPEQQPHRHHTILVALTANGFEETRNHCLSNGFDVFMSKPFSMIEFAQCLAECVRLIEKYNG